MTLQRTARTRYRSLLLALSTGVTLTLGLSSCMFAEPPNPLDANIPAGDDTPFQERQSLEDYAATIPPAIVEFQKQLAQAAGSEWKHDSSREQFTVTSCVEPDKQRGNYVRTSGGLTGPVSLERLLEIGNNIFTPLGLQSNIDREYNGGRYILWIDWHNGGYVRTYINQSRTTLAGDSDCRPSSDPERIRLELWALVPLPSESPASPDPSSPTPSHTRTARTPAKHPA